jgi:hypothetical protein
VVDSAVGSTAESINIRHLVDAGGLAVTDPVLPFFCYLKTRVQGFLFLVLCIAVGKFYCLLLICTRAGHPPTGVLLKIPLADLLALYISAVCCPSQPQDVTLIMASCTLKLLASEHSMLYHQHLLPPCFTWFSAVVFI